MTEFSSTAAGEKFNKGLDTLIHSNIAPISEAAIKVKAGIVTGRLLVAFSTPPLPSVESTTDFNMLYIPPGLVSMSDTYAPGILLDEIRVNSGTQADITCDLARTVIVASQYPNQGYERRLKTVYGEAIDLQRQFLESSDSEAIAPDPRTQDKDSLIETALGNARHFSDTGFEDYQTYIDTIKGLPESREQAATLYLMRDDLPQFLFNRFRFAGICYAAAVAANSPALAYDADERASLFSVLLVGKALELSSANRNS